MDAHRFLHYLFATLISIGLAVAPLSSTLAAGQRSSDPGMQMSDMSGDMPCCPDKQKQGDCQDCPLLAICTAKVLLDRTTATGLPVRQAKFRTLDPLDQPEIAGLTRPPPDHPPRTIV
jgi:hypothetical protein